MHATQFILQLAGFLYVTVGLAILFNKAHYHKLFNEMMNSPKFMYLAATLNLILGFFAVKFHNVWVADWPVVATILAWMVLLKGVWILWKPNYMKKFKFMTEMKHLGSLSTAVIILGLLFCYLGSMM